SEQGSIFPLPLGEGQGEGLARRNFVPHPNPLPEGEGDSKTGTKATRLAERINEARVANELKRIVGSANVTRLIDSDRAGLAQLLPPNNRTVIVAPANAAEASEAIILAAREKLSVAPAGTLSWLDTGDFLRDVDLIVTTRRMSKMIRHEPADLV